MAQQCICCCGKGQHCCSCSSSANSMICHTHTRIFCGCRWYSRVCHAVINNNATDLKKVTWERLGSHCFLFQMRVECVYAHVSSAHFLKAVRMFPHTARVIFD